MNALLELAERLKARALKERQIAANSLVVAQLLQPEIAKFEARDEPCNLYAVRLAIDHRDSAKRDAAFADDLEAAADALRARAAK